MSKRIKFSTATPNDQGGVIPNNVIDFSRFNGNPVALKEHKWSENPIGMWTDIKLEGAAWTGVPVFHRLTKESIEAADLYDAGFLRAASIGGEAIWKQNQAGQLVYDADGNRICEKFILYEISIVTLPSNADAVQVDPVQLHAKVYAPGELDQINNAITTLSSKFYNNNTMEPKKPEEKQPETSTQAAAQPQDPAAKPVEATEGIRLGANELPGFMERMIKGVMSAVGLGGATAVKPNTNATQPPTPENTPDSEKGQKEIEPQPGPTGLAAKAEKAKDAAEKAREAAESAISKAEAAKAKADAEGATDADKDAYKQCMDNVDSTMKAAEEAEAAYKKIKDEMEDKKPVSNSAKSTNSASKPQMKTMEELQADKAKLAAPPTEAAAHKAKVIREANGKTFSQLAADKGEGRAILNRVMASDAPKDLADYAIVLNSFLNDVRYAAVVEKMRVHMNVHEGQINSLRQMKPGTQGGYSLQNLSAQLASGQIEALGQDRIMRRITKLNSSDDALASPALTAIEWLPLAIFKLFPSTSWKSQIPIFAASVTGENLGIIWANITADPTIYKGTQPVTPADYAQADDAVAMKLTPYWLQPMIWKPLNMHMLRYDQMSTGWAQAFAKMGAFIDNDLIYTLASTVPAGSIVLSSGLSGYQTTPASFNISGPTDPNSFILNPSFTGDLKRPVLNDIVVIEQIFNKQNFNLEESGEKVVLAQDPTMDAFLAKDPATQSLLTRWVGADNEELVKFKHTLLPQRSQVALYDPATGQVKDPSGVVPATAVSAGLAFIPSQVGIGLGMLDVFMVQDPTAYGFRMSADIRMGAAPLRKNYDGTGLYTYAASNV